MKAVVVIFFSLFSIDQKLGLKVFFPEQKTTKNVTKYQLKIKVSLFHYFYVYLKNV